MTNAYAKFYLNPWRNAKVVRVTRFQWTDGQDTQTDRLSDRPTDRLTPIYPLSNFVCGGIKKVEQVWCVCETPMPQLSNMPSMKTLCPIVQK